MENIWKERLDGKMENHGGFEQQDSSGDQKVLRLSDLRCYGHSLVSHARPTSRAGVHPQILLTRLKMIRHEELGMNLPARLAAHLAQGLDKPLAVVVVEDRFAPVPTVHNVVHSPGY